MCDGIQCAENVKASPAGRSLYKEAREGPQNPEKRCEDEVCGIDKKIARLPCLASSMRGSNSLSLKLSCASGLAFDGIAPTFLGRIPSEFRNLPTALGLRFSPVSSSIFCIASLMLAGGWSAK